MRGVQQQPSGGTGVFVWGHFSSFGRRAFICRM
jgi:hypothetical protein